VPIPTNYGSTGRPPGEYHLHHSSKKLAHNLEFLQPPFDIFFIEITNDNNNNNNNCIICYDNNDGIICNEGVLVDSEAGAADDADNDDVDVDVDVLRNQNESNR
jgi:hypothetical protein